MYSLGLGFVVWVFLQDAMKNPNELFGQPDIHINIIPQTYLCFLNIYSLLQLSAIVLDLRHLKLVQHFMLLFNIYYK